MFFLFSQFRKGKIWRKTNKILQRTGLKKVRIVFLNLNLFFREIADFKIYRFLLNFFTLLDCVNARECYFFSFLEIFSFFGVLKPFLTQKILRWAIHFKRTFTLNLLFLSDQRYSLIIRFYYYVLNGIKHLKLNQVYASAFDFS